MRTGDDFRREVEKKLRVELFPELTEQEINSKLQVSESILGSSGKWSLGNEVSSLSPHQSTPLSVGIQNYIDERGKIRTKSL